jgi:hypothetical protein
MRMRRQTRDVRHFIVGTLARAEGRAADIDRIGAVIDGFDAEIGIFRGRKQFQRVALRWSSAIGPGRAMSG